MINLPIPRLFELGAPQHQAGCPILVEDGALLKQANGKLAVQLELVPMDQRPVSAVIVRVNMLDITLRPLGSVEHHYLDLTVPPFKSFGDRSLIQLENQVVRAFTVAVRSVVYQDGTIWENPSDTALVPLPEAIPLPFGAQLLEQYHRTMNCPQLRYLPQVQGGLWQCGCGAWNADAASQCRICTCSLLQQQELADERELMPRLKAWLARQEQLRKEEAERALAAEKEAEAKAQQTKRRACITAITAGVIAAAAAIVYFAVIPPVFTGIGDDAFEAKRYQDAYDAYATARDGEKARKAAQLAGDAYMAEGDYAKAEIAYGNAQNGKAQEDAMYFRLAQDSYKHNQALPEDVYTYTNAEYGSSIGFVRFGENGWVTPPLYSSVVNVPGLTDCDSSIILATTGRVGYSSEQTYVISPADGSSKLLGTLVEFKGSSEGFWIFTSGGGAFPQYAFMDKDGNVLGGKYYGYVEPFSEGVAAVRPGSSFSGPWGYIDATGQAITKVEFDSAYDMKNGYAQVIKNGKWGLIDKTGKFVIQPTWGYVEASESFVQEGVAKVKTNKQFEDGGYYGLVRLSDSTVVLNAEWTEMGDEFGDGLLYVHKNSSSYFSQYYPCLKAGFVTSSGQMKIDLMALGIDGSRECSEAFENGYAVLSAWIDTGHRTRDIQDCIISKDGKIVVPFTEDSIYRRSSDKYEVVEWTGSKTRVVQTYYVVDSKLTTTRPNQ